ncbi:hypothetical protein GF345_04360 [Candidatus Woesearchaeota archaeon]|nr:hypothetical protein [Candidatus Woesearchaeota archaeon]
MASIQETCNSRFDLAQILFDFYYTPRHGRALIDYMHRENMYGVTLRLEREGSHGLSETLLSGLAQE